MKKMGLSVKDIMTMKNTDNDISRNNRDETIGRALAAAIAEQEAPGSCLTDEDMAAIIDGSLPASERDLCMQHLSSCETCFKAFSISQGLLVKEAVPSLRNRFVLPSAGLAIAALIAIVLRISFQDNSPDKPITVAENKPTVTNAQKQIAMPAPAAIPALPDVSVATAYSPPSAAETARLLINKSDVEALQIAISSDKTQIFGFSGVVPRENRAFRLGVQAAVIELLIQANDRNGAVKHLKLMVDLLSSTSKAPTDAAQFEQIIRSLESGSPLKANENCTDSINKILTTKNEQFLYRFGVWAEGGRLAATVGNKGSVSVSSIRYIKEGVKGMQLPPGLLKAIQEVDEIVKRSEFSENDFFVMKRAFEDVTAIF
ncbi:MAG: hypothetical protein ACOYL3_27140 [Desulfuromonadaceae bacterium]